MWGNLLRSSLCTMYESLFSPWQTIKSSRYNVSSRTALAAHSATREHTNCTDFSSSCKNGQFKLWNREPSLSSFRTWSSCCRLRYEIPPYTNWESKTSNHLSQQKSFCIQIIVPPIQPRHYYFSQQVIYLTLLKSKLCWQRNSKLDAWHMNLLSIDENVLGKR